MSRTTATVSFSATITLSEVEVRALDAMIGYGADAFIKVFYDKLGQGYMRDHEAGLRSFFVAVGRDVLPALHEIDQARRDLEKAARARIEARAAAQSEFAALSAKAPQ
jgi:hypothetical protein